MNFELQITKSGSLDPSHQSALKTIGHNTLDAYGMLLEFRIIQGDGGVG